MAKKEADVKTYASIEIPTVAAAVDGLLRLETEAQAVAFLENIAEHHILSREQVPAAKKLTLTLWIRGYDITPAEKKEGALGNFATLAYKQVNKRWTIYPTKLLLPPEKHPQRKYVARGSHPNWGHPILKAIQKGKLYQAIEDAQADLQRIHEQYPTSTIPTKQKLYVMVFTRVKGKPSASPIEKWVLEPTVTPEGLFTISLYPNTGKARKATPEKTSSSAAPRKSADESTSTKGVFTARETLRRTKKKR